MVNKMQQIADKVIANYHNIPAVEAIVIMVAHGEGNIAEAQLGFNEMYRRVVYKGYEAQHDGSIDILGSEAIVVEQRIEDCEKAVQECHLLAEELDLTIPQMTTYEVWDNLAAILNEVQVEAEYGDLNIQ